MIEKNKSKTSVFVNKHKLFPEKCQHTRIPMFKSFGFVCFYFFLQDNFLLTQAGQISVCSVGGCLLFKLSGTITELWKENIIQPAPWAFASGFYRTAIKDMSFSRNPPAVWGMSWHSKHLTIEKNLRIQRASVRPGGIFRKYASCLDFQFWLRVKRDHVC